MTSPPENAAERGPGDENRGPPTPLLLAAGLAAIEGAVLLAYGVVEVFRLSGDRAVMGATVSIFFVAFGALLAFCGWGLSRVRPWTRGPVLLAQLIQLGLAWNFRQGGTLPVAIVLAVLAVAVLAGLLNPRSVEAIESAADRS